MKLTTDKTLKTIPPFEVDYLAADEKNLVCECWKGAVRGNFKHLPNAVFNVGMDKFIAALAQTQRLLVARATDGRPEPVLGFLCFREYTADDPALVVHFAYTKLQYRNQGVARSLLTAAGWTPGLIIMGSERWKAPKDVRRKHNVYWNEFFARPGYV